MRFIGSKVLLLNHIKEMIDEKAPGSDTFCDIFSGTTAVSRYFKQWYEVTSNDLLYFSYVLQKATIENDEVPTFELLKARTGIADPITFFNNLETRHMEALLPREKRFFQNTYAPSGGRMYLTDENALRIDFARNTVEDWKDSFCITDNEYYYLVACIVEGIPFVSNISGTYGAYHKTWDRRSYKKYELFRLDVCHNGRHNRCFNRDGVELLKEVSGDILYIDPPYNERQYLPNYHVLETAARYDYPDVHGVTAQRSGDSEKSDFCQKGKVEAAFASLLESAHFRHIVLSYSTDGLMPPDTVEAIMKSYGDPETFEMRRIPYRRYKSRAHSKEEELSELLVYIEKKEPLPV